MKIIDKILAEKDKIQSFVNDVNCNDDKWFMYDTLINKNPVVKNWSTKMSYKVMARNIAKFSSRFIYLKVAEDMWLGDPKYRGLMDARIDDMDLENEKYAKVNGGIIMKEKLEEYGLVELFSDERIFTVHYLEAISGVDPHIDPWEYDHCGRNYRNMLFYDPKSLPDDFTLIINGKNTEITSPMLTNYANDTHTYQFVDQPDNLIRLVHIDYENEGIS